MGTIEVDVWVPGAVGDVAPRWLDTEHWPDWMDEVEEVLEVSADWPAAGSTVRWRSPPSGRGEVVETVVEHEPDDLQVNDVLDAQLTARQTVTFTAVDEGVAVALTLEYRITKRGPFTPILDRFFVRPAIRSSLTSTIERFGGQFAAHGEP
jgi:uncharacterized membrane protein